jgi:hypothetical protein
VNISWTTAANFTIVNPNVTSTFTLAIVPWTSDDMGESFLATVPLGQHSWTWSKVNIAIGCYAIQAYTTSTQDAVGSSYSWWTDGFEVVNGPDTSCVPSGYRPTALPGTSFKRTNVGAIVGPVVGVFFLLFALWVRTGFYSHDQTSLIFSIVP